MCVVRCPGPLPRGHAVEVSGASERAAGRKPLPERAATRHVRGFWAALSEQDREAETGGIRDVVARRRAPHDGYTVRERGGIATGFPAARRAVRRYKSG